MKAYGYGHQTIDEDDIRAVTDVLRSDYLTCGPAIMAFEQALCAYTGAKYCVAVSSATAGLHIAMLAAGIGTNDEVITTPITFLASANCARYVGAKVIFADIEPDTANIDPNEIARRITPQTRAIIPVHFAGQSCDMRRIRDIANSTGREITIIEDAAHAIGSEYLDHKVGCCQYSDMAVFSFHPVKTITTGEGGAVVTNNVALYKKLCAFRSHGTYRDAITRLLGEPLKPWEYAMKDLGFNYRMTDIQAALGKSQLTKIDTFKRRRREIVEYYNQHLGLPHLTERGFSNACFHLYPIFVNHRAEFYAKAKELGLNLQVHYIPVHLQPYYAQFGYQYGDYPNAEAYYAKCISLPLYPALTNTDLDEIVARIRKIVSTLN